jgi:hypothetical protein
MISSRNRSSLLYSRISPSSSGVSDAIREALAAASSPGAPLPAITPTTDAPAICGVLAVCSWCAACADRRARLRMENSSRQQAIRYSNGRKDGDSNKQQRQDLKPVMVSMADTAHFLK